MAKTVTHKQNLRPNGLQDLKSLFGEEDLLEKSQGTSFAAMVFEMLSERQPLEDELRIFELILNLSIDHGSETPSSLKVIEASKDGKTMPESLSKGILEINEHHGGAGEGLMEILYKIQNEKGKVQNIVAKYIKEDKKLPGFGHRIYKDKDPRAELVFDKLSVLGVDGNYIDIARQIQVEFEEQTGKHLPINIDGAIACALCSFGWEPKLSAAVFLVARTPGLIAHYLNNA